MIAVLGRFDLALLFLAFGLLVTWKHRANIDRVFAGTEPKVGRSKDG
jgi:glycerol-3-phosphate acyltransferase PlsY